MLDKLARRGVDISTPMKYLKEAGEVRNQKTYSIKTLAKISAWNAKRKMENKARLEQANQQTEVKQTPSQQEQPKQAPKKTAEEFKKDERAKQLYNDVPKAKENAYKNLEKLKNSNKFKQRALNLAWKLKETDRKGQDTVPVLMDIEELIEEYNTMKNFQLEK